MSTDNKIGSIFWTQYSRVVFWTIPGFSQLSSTPGIYYSSHKFSVGDSLWNFELYPNGEGNRCKDNIALYVNRDNGLDVDFSFSLGIVKSHSFKMMKSEVNGQIKSGSKRGGASKIISRLEVLLPESEILLGDALKVKCMLTLQNSNSAEIEKRWESLLNFRSRLKVIQEEGQCSDIVLEVGKVEIKAHRMILAARSSVFADLLRRDTSQSISITDTTADIFKEILCYMYYGETGNMSSRNVCQIYEAADKYQLAELKDLCSNFMKSNMSSDLFFEILSMASTCKNPVVKNIIRDYYGTHSSSILETSEWKLVNEKYNDILITPDKGITEFYNLRKRKKLISDFPESTIGKLESEDSQINFKWVLSSENNSIIFESIQSVPWNLSTGKEVCCSSPVFHVSNMHWHLQIISHYKENIGLYIVRTGAEDFPGLPKIKEFKIISSLSSSSLVMKPRFEISKNQWGKPYFIERDVLNLLLLSGFPVIEFKLKFSASLLNIEDMDGEPASSFDTDQLTKKLLNLSRSTEELLNSGQFSDVILKVGERDFKAHKVILVAQSSVFAAMFQHDMVESRTSCVTIEDIEVDVFEELLFYMYCNKVRLLCKDNVRLIYMAADKYDLTYLRKMCTRYITHQIMSPQGRFYDNTNRDMFWEALEIACVYEETELMSTLKEYFSQFCHRLLDSSEWQIFLLKHPTFAIKLLTSECKKEKIIKSLLGMHSWGNIKSNLSQEWDEDTSSDENSDNSSVWGSGSSYNFSGWDSSEDDSYF